jgi:membrane associated rhomboid family serine protease
MAIVSPPDLNLLNNKSFAYMANYRQTRFPAIPTVIKYLIIINVVVWLMEIMWKGGWFVDFFALHDFRSSLFKPHQLISHLFLHDPDPRDFLHLFFNMFALWMFGGTLENYWGAKRFFNFYLICGIGAAVIYLAFAYFVTDMPGVRALAEFRDHPSQELLSEICSRFHFNPDAFSNSADEAYFQLKEALFGQPTLGASGAVFGVLVAFGYTFPNTEMFIIPIPFPVKAKYLVGGYILIELFTGFQNRPGDNVAHFAHLGGALVGFLLVVYWNKTNKRDFY